MTRCVIIDDEPLAIEILETYIAQVKGAAVIARFTDPVDAFSYLQQHEVDVVFLDLNMPMLNGMELLKSLNNRPAMIVTTAYRDYAVESFELDVVDYLVKPIAFPRFLKAFNKTSSLKKSIPAETTVEDKHENNSVIWLKVDKKLVPVMLADILYIQSLKDYVRVVTTNQKIVTYSTLQAIFEKLPAPDFVRIHKSYVVHVSKVQSIEGNMVHVKGESLPIGRNFRKSLFEVLPQ